MKKPEANKESVFPSRVFPAGKIIFREGQKSDNAYLIKSGRVKVTRDQGGRSILLDFLSAPQIFGEMAFINKEPRSATVETMEKCELVVIEYEQLEAYLERSPTIIRALVQCLSQRLKVTTACIQKGGIDNNLTSACYALSLMNTQYPTDTTQTSNSLNLDFDKASKAVSRSLGISQQNGDLLLERIAELGLITIFKIDGTPSIGIKDRYRLQEEARKLNLEKSGPSPAQQEGYLDIQDLANLMGTSAEKIRQKIASGEIPDRLIHFYKLELFDWIDQL